MAQSYPEDVRQRAAKMVAADELTDSQICEQLGIGRTTLFRWKQEEDFDRSVDEFRRSIHEDIRKRGIAILENRVKAQNDRWRRMRRVIAERAADEGMENVPGGKTGLLARTYKAIAGEPVEVFEVDTGLLREMRELEELTARELGQREVKVQQRTEVTSPFDRAITERLAADPDFASRAEDLYFLMAGVAGNARSSGDARSVDTGAAPADGEQGDHARGGQGQDDGPGGEHRGDAPAPPREE